MSSEFAAKDSSVVFAFTLALLIPGCQCSSNSDDVPDSQTGGDSDTDSDSDSDSDADTDADTDLCALGEFEGEAWIGSQEELDALAGYTSITKSLRIAGCAECTDVSPLVCLEAIHGLQITENASLADLTGLGGLTSVVGVYIADNPTLANLHGLGGITELEGDLNIWENHSLASLEGLSALEKVGGPIHIDGNDSLSNLDGLSALTEVFETTLSFSENPSLPDCEVCELLDQLIEGQDHSIVVHDNLEDACTPVPDNCP